MGIREKHLNELVRTYNTAVGMARSWMVGTRLKLTDHKTDFLLINSSKSKEFITITVGEWRITSKQAINDLGVVTYNRRRFRRHLKYKDLPNYVLELIKN